MSSINDQQPEENHEDLMGSRAVERIQSMVKKAGTCFLVTKNGRGPTSGVRPMSVRKVDDEGNIWFLSPADSSQNEEIGADRSVELYVQGSPRSGFMHLTGRAEISRDQGRIDELWQPFIKTWFTGGKEDPRITVIKVIPHEGYYWDNKHGEAIAGAKIMLGALIGKTLDDSIEGKLAP